LQFLAFLNFRGNTKVKLLAASKWQNETAGGCSQRQKQITNPWRAPHSVKTVKRTYGERHCVEIAKRLTGDAYCFNN